MKILLPRFYIKQIYIMFQRLFSNTTSCLTQFSHIGQLESAYKDWQSFFKEIQSWKNIEFAYIAKLQELVKNLKDKSQPIIAELSRVFATLLEGHTNLIIKINNDVMSMNKQSSDDMLNQFKNVIEKQKQLCKGMFQNRQAVYKNVQKNEKVMKTLQDQMVLQAFMEDSVECTPQKKLRRDQKVKEYQKQKQGYENKIKQHQQNYFKLLEKSDSNLIQANHLMEQSIVNLHETISKIDMHLCNHFTHLQQKFTEMSNETSVYMNKRQIQPQFKKRAKQFQLNVYFHKGYLDVMLAKIKNKQLDQVLQIWRDNETKSKIKKIIETKNITAEQTDEITREIQIFKKILKNSKDQQAVKSFKTIINKHYKYRIIFIFILQNFRLNSKFQICQDDAKGILLMIQQVLVSCEMELDSFILKHLMALLSTYYISIKDEKIYLLQFFKQSKVWRSMQFWQAILVQCIYVEKRKTIKMCLSNNDNTNGKLDVLAVEKSAIMNQILYVVKNMVLFDFEEKEVKNFALKFSRLLNQDDKSLKNVYESISEAISEQHQEVMSNQRELVLNYLAQISSAQ